MVHVSWVQRHRRSNIGPIRLGTYNFRTVCDKLKKSKQFKEKYYLLRESRISGLFSTRRLAKTCYGIGLRDETYCSCGRRAIDNPRASRRRTLINIFELQNLSGKLDDAFYCVDEISNVFPIRTTETCDY